MKLSAIVPVYNEVSTIGEILVRVRAAPVDCVIELISYRGRTYAEGKKIGWRDAVAAFWRVAVFRLFG